MPPTDSSDQAPLLSEQTGRLELLIERFEEAWQKGEHPAIDEYRTDAAVDPQALLVELVHVELECRLKAGEAVRVEEYLQRYPEIGGDQEQVLGLIAAECRLRQRQEPALALDEYLGRFPQYRDLLPARLPRRAALPSRLSCPHCLKPITLGHDADETALTCPSCGNSFRLDMEAPAWAPSELAPLGHFELLQAVGMGAFGTVYRAHDTELDRIVAVKVPRGGRHLTPADVDRFAREARNAARLNHPAIVPLYEVGHGPPVPYLVSAFIRGQTLADALSERRFGFREAADVLAQAAEALDHAHRQGVVHRDLKPSNIMLGQIEGARPSAEGTVPETGPRVFVMDFGLALRDEGEVTVTVEGQILGTPAYMSPEQARGDSHHVDGRSDIYSLGVILYELLTGELPFRGAVRMVLQQILTEEPRNPRRLNDKIPRDLETIALKCLAKEPGKRYATAGDLAADLRRYLGGEPIRARPVGRLERTWRWARRNPRVALLTAAVAVLLLTVSFGSGVAAVVIGWERDAALKANAAAEKRLDLTLTAYDKLVFEVQDQLEDKPALELLKQSLLNTALEGLEQVAGSAAADHVEHNIAVAHLRRGEIFLVLGRTAEARQAYQQLHALAAAEAAADPDNPKLQGWLATAEARLGDVSLRLGETEAARGYYRQALERSQRVEPADADNAKLQRDLAVLCNKLADVSLQLGDLKAARTYGCQGLDRLERLADADAESLPAQRHLAGGYERLGNVQLRAGETAAAQTAYRRALDLYQRLTAANPQSIQARRDLSVAYQKLGDLALQVKDFAAARTYCRQALEPRQALLAEDPQNAVARRDLALTWERLGHAQLGLGETAAAQSDFQRALDLREQLAAADPDSAQAQIDLASSCYNLGEAALHAREVAEALALFERCAALLRQLEIGGKIQDAARYRQWQGALQNDLALAKAVTRAVDDLDFALAQPAERAAILLGFRAAILARRGQVAEAAATADKLAKLAPTDPTNLYNVACCYALCAAGVAPGKPSDELTAEQAALRRDYTQRALAALTEAARRGARDISHLDTDPDLAALRSDPGYRKLVQQLQTSKRGAKP